MAPPATLNRFRDAGTAAAILAGACVWTFVSGAASGGDPIPVVAVVSAGAAALVVAALVSRGRPWVVPALVVGGAAIVAVAGRAEILTSRPEQGPFGYANATGAFYLQATIAGLMLAVSAPRAEGRWIGWLGAAAFAGITLATGSAAAAGLLALPAAGFVLSVSRRGRPVMVGMAALFAVALFGTIVVGSLAGEPGNGTLGGRIFDERRETLWHQAVTTIGEHPLTGVGPGAFVEDGPLVRIDADARWAHHGFLQFGAETGIPGMGLVTLAFVWLLVSLAGRSDPAVFTVLGSAALAVFGIGACVDYLFHFPAITVTAAALAGAASTHNEA
ncbi:MAG: O-antigen ligase family protein [Actinomycetota bacterium]